jgi:sialate O-acetylesterase
MSGPARDSTSIAARLDARWREAMKEWTPERVARYAVDMAAWNRAEERAKETGTENTLVWPQPPATLDSPAMPGGLFNGMIAPLQPCALRGILWYQGESNTERAGEYSELFKTMIGAWRTGWGEGDLPFYFVQIANFGDPKERKDRGWPRLREAQTSALSLPATGMAVIIDIGQADNVHPVNKQDVGHRLALLAEAGTYGMSVECHGPEFAGMTREGGALRVRFEHATGGLIAKGQVQALEVAGADRVFHDATGVIDGATLVVSSPDVPEPVAVRYAWTNAPTANLYNKAGLPAVPFRSDDW